LDDSADPIHVDAGQFGRLRVVADRVDVGAPGGESEDVGEDGVQGQHHPDPQHQPERADTGRLAHHITQAVETLSGGQRQAVAVARAAAFGSKLIILDEPTAALGVRESARVLQLIDDLRNRGMPVILISHNMPQVFELADRIHVQRLGRRAAVITPQTHTMNDAVAIMTGALEVDPADQTFGPVRSPAGV
jgi:ABC-type sugar transport system ATPase subunit